MKGLLYKDLLLIREIIISGLSGIFSTCVSVFILILGIEHGNLQEIKELEGLYDLFFKGFIVFVIGMGTIYGPYVSSAITEDRRSEWFKVLYSSPVTLWQEILSRYLVAFIINIIMSFCTGIFVPILYLAAGRSFGLGDFKLVIYGWLVGMLIILVRLPIDIIFTEKVSIIIMTSISFVVLTIFMIWLSQVQYLDIIIAELAKVIEFIYNNAVVIICLVVIGSFLLSYFGKRNRRWA